MDTAWYCNVLEMQKRQRQSFILYLQYTEWKCTHYIQYLQSATGTRRMRKYKVSTLLNRSSILQLQQQQLSDTFFRLPSTSTYNSIFALFHFIHSKPRQSSSSTLGKATVELISRVLIMCRFDNLDRFGRLRCEEE